MSCPVVCVWTCQLITSLNGGIILVFTQKSTLKSRLVRSYVAVDKVWEMINSLRSLGLERKRLQTFPIWETFLRLWVPIPRGILPTWHNRSRFFVISQKRYHHWKLYFQTFYCIRGLRLYKTNQSINSKTQSIYCLLKTLDTIGNCQRPVF